MHDPQLRFFNQWLRIVVIHGHPQHVSSENKLLLINSNKQSILWNILL